ncbi:hypothetical protein KIW84_062578 [Lathyrus oleraceus]|uniref:DUF7745 domain-containing protein n=1 Tax=Pisum sativum TaxID=3888 RepID=A0A9D5A5R4_PEA|nr:hypothetical protein KIW84_062578 [Pisum sativum]
MADTLTMDIGRRNTRKYSFRCPDLMELRKLAYFVDDPKGFRDHFGRLLSMLSTNVEDGLLCTLVQFYDPVYRCFTFPNYQLLPTVEEYAYVLSILVFDRVPFSGMEGILESQVIDEAIHLRKSDIDGNLIVKGGIRGLTSTFLLEKSFSFANANSIVAFETILVLLIYGLVLFPNIDNFVDVNAMRIFLIRNPFISHLPLSPIFQENNGCLRWSQRLMSLTNGDITWYSSVYDDVGIIDSCGELSNVPLLGTQGGINYNPDLARHQLGFAMKDKPNNTLLEGLIFQEGNGTQGLKARIVHAWHNIHRKGKGELGLKNCVALESYTS